MKIQVSILISIIIVGASAPSPQAKPVDDRLKALQIGVRSTLDSTKQLGREHDNQSRRRSILVPSAFVMVVHTIGMGMLVSMDPVETGFKPLHVDNWADGMSKMPIWDNDSWITNYILHPLWGSETYLQARSAHFSAVESFLFSTAASVVWEYGFESWAEHPSKQDLLVTSTVGSLLGEVRYVARRALIDQDGAWATLALIFVDPFGVMMWYVERAVGDFSGAIASLFESDVTIAPSFSDAASGGPSTKLALRVSISL